jgi:hypothetical protein
MAKPLSQNEITEIALKAIEYALGLDAPALSGWTAWSAYAASGEWL